MISFQFSSSKKIISRIMNYYLEKLRDFFRSICWKASREINARLKLNSFNYPTKCLHFVCFDCYFSTKVRKIYAWCFFSHFLTC